ncbi:MAG: glycine--tRNA ligase [Chloroflexi bacterium]|nr:MAG: glycine--tRNA ligase [Chloroflexota bacterium]TME15975.1 MAG: glycine--tRNA ligase [Chloroflexota bacterium]TME18801.1 MAG: glycine--tRNA ligase [Chloroflexota bacterium]
MEKVTALCKRRGFIFQSSEIYGGLSGFYDYGPYGVALKRNIRELWWRHLVELRDDVVGLESTLIMHPEVWKASGHVDNFVDPLVQCLGECKRRWRADQLQGGRCPNCGGELSEPRLFNLMFATHVGPVADSASEVYLRPETAQGMFVDFKNVLNSTRVRIPFGIAQQGRAFRNEITPGNFVFRLREFELMEMEYFVKPGDDDRWFEYWRAERMRWYQEVLGVRADRLRFFDHPKESLSHYSKQTTDIEYDFPFGWGELEGVADRTDFDLRTHQERSGEDLSYLDPETNERYLPWVIEPAVGADRIAVMLLLDAYDEDEVKGETRVVLRFHRNVAPVQVAVMPLSKKEELIGPAREIVTALRPHFRVEYDQTGGNIGRRYRRQDEVGTPYCVTVDFESLQDRAVTIRERDSMEQVRVPIADLAQRLQERFQL